jgi:hypothetical protein
MLTALSTVIGLAYFQTIDIPLAGISNQLKQVLPKEGALSPTAKYVLHLKKTQYPINAILPSKGE